MRMQTRPTSVPPRLGIAVFWIASMVLSWACGALLFGFDFGTTLIWLALLILGPLLVWAFVALLQVQPQSRTQFRASSRGL